MDMPKLPNPEAELFIKPLNMNGLSGRMLVAPATGKYKREILLIYGHHAMLERWWSLVENLRPFGTVTMPDMPGFGGMESFSKKRIKPSIDAYADYLASYIKLRYKQKHITIFGISYGFIVVTRMLQRYPELTNKVDLLVSVVGFMHHDDLWARPYKQRAYRIIARFLATRPMSVTIRYCFLNKFVIDNFYAAFSNSKRRMAELKPEDSRAMLDFEVQLWRANDVRTHWLTTYELLRVDNCKDYVRLPVSHVISNNDFYLDNLKVEQHMRQVFTKYTQYRSDSKAHVPSVMADKKAMSVLLPSQLKKRLRQKS